MIGIPEPDEKLNEISSQKNLCIITHEGLDAAFILKSLGSDRGKIYPKDLIELGKSNIFKRNLHPNEEKNLPPKLVSIWAFNIKNENYDYSETNDYYENNRQNYKRYLEATLASISKKVMSQESKEKLRALNIETDENYRKYRNNHEIYFYFKNAEYEEMKKRIDSLLIFPPNNGLRKDTVKSLINIINEIKQFKNEKLIRNVLIKLSQFNTNLIGSFFSIMSKDENGKMFQFLNNKRNIRNGKKAKESIQKRIQLFQTDVKKLFDDESDNINENSVDSTSSLKIELLGQIYKCKEDFKEKISSYFEIYIEKVKNFYEKNPEVSKKYELNKNLTDEYDFKYFVEENLPTFDEQFKTLKEDFVKSTTEIICAKYDSIKTEIYLEKESKNNQNGLESLNLLYENSTILKAKKIIISNKELVDNENCPKLFMSSSSTKIPSSNTILLEIKDLNTKYESKEMKELDYVKSLAKLLKDKKLLSNYARNDNTEARIKKILEWKSNEAKWNFSRSLSSISKATTKDFDIELVLELKLENDNEIDKLKINCDNTSYLKIENKIKSLNKKQASTRNENFQDENIVLNPIFIWINFENLIQQKTINNRNNSKNHLTNY